MKKIKKFGVLFLTLAMVFVSSLSVNASPVIYTNTTVWKGDGLTKMHIGVKQARMDVIDLDLDNKNYSVSDIISSSSNLKAWKAHDITVSGGEHRVQIGIYAKAAGTYNVTYNIVDSNSAVVESRSVAVLADNSKPFSYVKVNGKKAKFNYRNGGWKVKTGNFSTNKKKATMTVQVKMKKGYTLKGIYVEKHKYVSGKYKTVDKEIKNGKKYKASKVGAFTDTESYVKIKYVDDYTGKVYTTKGIVNL